MILALANSPRTKSYHNARAQHALLIRSPRVRTPLPDVIPTVMFVAIDRSFVEAFRKDFPAVLALSVAHAAAARQRIPVTKPLVVVVASTVSKPELEELIDVAGGVGAEVLRMPGESATPISYFRIKKALIERLDKRRR